jgi:hypothetical protein
VSHCFRASAATDRNSVIRFCIAIRASLVRLQPADLDLRHNADYIGHGYEDSQMGSRMPENADGSGLARATIRGDRVSEYVQLSPDGKPTRSGRACE